MATVSNSVSAAKRAAKPRAGEYPAGGLRFDWAAISLSAWFVAGIYVDGWAHNYLPGEFETFLTPWHAVLYSGFLAVSLFHIFHQARNMARGFAFIRALPQGYWLSLVGIAVFGLGGNFDFVWHEIFGFEEDIEALLSPAHFVLATGGVLICLGPLRAAWRRSGQAGWAQLAPAMLSLFLLLGVLTFFTQYAHFITDPWVLFERPARDFFFRDLYGVTSVLIPTVLISGVVLFGIRRWTLPPGSLFLLVGANTLMMFVMTVDSAGEVPSLVLASLAAGLLADGLYAWLKPSAERLRAVRAFAFLVPFSLFLLYFLALLLTAGTWWTIHMWFGVTLQAGVVGYLLSFLAFAPGGPAAESASASPGG